MIFRRGMTGLPLCGAGFVSVLDPWQVVDHDLTEDSACVAWLRVHRRGLGDESGERVGEE